MAGVVALAQLALGETTMVMTALSKSELFRALDQEAAAEIAQAATLKRSRAGSRLLKQGDRPDHLYCVLDGRFKMTTVSKDGAEKTLRFMEAGDLIGCAAVFKASPIRRARRRPPTAWRQAGPRANSGTC